MFDFLQEILATIRRNKMRTFLTGFAVAWGIFLLIILLGAGNGLQNGFMSNFGGQTLNSVYVYPGRTSVAFDGYRAGRRISLDNRDMELLRREIPEIEYLSAGIGHGATLTYGDEYGSWYCYGVSSGMQYLFDMRIYRDQGRFINEIDVTQRRKVVVLSNYTAEVLFGTENPVGKYIRVDQAVFQVVGVYDDENHEEVAYVPFTTAQALWFGGWGVSRISFSVNGLDTKSEINAFNDEVRRVMGAYHRFDPTDRSALGVYNNAEAARQLRTIFTAISIFIWVIGIACMMAGIIGVGNIMLITVRERTREIGIRKALGARPRSILTLILLEAVFIMTAAGYAGILMGVGVTEVVSGALFSETASVGADGEWTPTFFLNTTVELGTMVAATIFLIVCGTLAGLVPALKATRVRPIEAMRAE